RGSTEVVGTRRSKANDDPTRGAQSRCRLSCHRSADYGAPKSSRSRHENFGRASRLIVMSSEVENRAAREAARWTGKPDAERRGRERIISLDTSGVKCNQRFLDSARNDKIKKATQPLFAALTVYHDKAPHSAAIKMAI